MVYDYTSLLQQDVLELNKRFAEVFELSTPFDNWRSAQIGELYGVIDIPVIAPADGKPEDVRTGFELQDVAIEIVLVAIAASRVEASALGASMALRLKAGIKQVQVFASENLKLLSNLTIRGEIPIKKDQVPKTPFNWIVQVAASGNAICAIYKNVQGEPIEPPVKYARSQVGELAARMVWEQMKNQRG